MFRCRERPHRRTTRLNSQSGPFLSKKTTTNESRTDQERRKCSASFVVIEVPSSLKAEENLQPACGSPSEVRHTRQRGGCLLLSDLGAVVRLRRRSHFYRGSILRRLRCRIKFRRRRNKLYKDKRAALTKWRIVAGSLSLQTARGRHLPLELQMHGGGCTVLVLRISFMFSVSCPACHQMARKLYGNWSAV